MRVCCGIEYDIRLITAAISKPHAPSHCTGRGSVFQQLPGHPVPHPVPQWSRPRDKGMERLTLRITPDEKSYGYLYWRALSTLYLVEDVKQEPQRRCWEISVLQRRRVTHRAAATRSRRLPAS